MKRITIIVSGGQEDSLAKQLAKGAAPAAGRKLGCRLQPAGGRGGPKRKRKPDPTSREEPFVAKKGLQVMGFMSPGTC